MKAELGESHLFVLLLARNKIFDICCRTYHRSLPEDERMKTYHHVSEEQRQLISSLLALANEGTHEGSQGHHQASVSR